MLILVFALLLAAVLAVWRGKRRPAVYLLLVVFLLAGFWFDHHATSQLGLQL